MAKVKIKPAIPETPNFADLGWRYSYTTPDLDFMEEFMIPSKADYVRGFPLASYTSQRMGLVEGQGDMEDVATTYRATRDIRLKAIAEYYGYLVYRKPLGFQDIAVDLWGMYDDHELTRFQFPAKDGSMNFPEWRVVDSEFHLMFGNHPYREAAFKIISDSDIKAVINDMFGYNEFNDNETLWNQVMESFFPYMKEANEKSLTLANLPLIGTEWSEAQEANLIQLKTDYLAAKQAYIDGKADLFDPSVNAYTDFKTYFNFDGTFELLPSVKYIEELGAITGAPGQFIFVQNQGDIYAWIPEIGWTFNNVIEIVTMRVSDVMNDRARALNDLIICLQPFTFAAHHMPAMRLFSEIQGVENRVIVDDYAAINAAMNAANNPA